jgi:hypothetical protein
MANDLLRTHDGRWLPIEDAGKTRGPVPAYNMQVSEFHTYFVGRPEWGFAIWAHNSFRCIIDRKVNPHELHHITSQPTKTLASQNEMKFSFAMQGST